LKVYTHVTEKMKKNANAKIKNHFSDILQIWLVAENVIFMWFLCDFIEKGSLSGAL
jgi:hypothetical protein